MLLSAADLTKSYSIREKKIPILNKLNLNIPHESITAIVGPSGSGKSTLLSVLAGLDRPESGTLSFDGHLMSEMSERKATQFRGQNIGIVFQQFHLVSHMTALENVSLPIWLNNNLDAKERAVKALADVGLENRADHKPHELSGGECQRVAIARALIHRPKLILADEPTGNLDQETGDRIVKLLFDIIREHKTSLILVTHDKNLSSQCDQTFALNKGQLS